MDKELRKRLEEAAEKIAPVGFDQWGVSVARDVFKFGAEHGYKEAIKQAKEWLSEHGKLDTLDLVEFDMEMEKYWEEKK